MQQTDCQPNQELFSKSLILSANHYSMQQVSHYNIWKTGPVFFPNKEFGNAGPIFCNAGPVNGNVSVIYGYAGPIYGNAGPIHGNTGPMYENAGPIYGNAGPIYGILHFAI